MASRYWVGGTATWDATAGTKWATTSGGAGGAAVPTAADDVFFDANSGAVTITTFGTTTDVCRSLNCTGFTGTLTIASTTKITIGDATAGASNIALKLVPGMTLNRGSSSSYVDIEFASTSATQQTITTGAKNLGKINFKGIGGSWALADSLNTTGSSVGILLTAGTLDFNNQTVSTGQLFVEGTLGSARTLNLTSSSITLSGIFSCSNAANLTVNAGTSTITMTSAGSYFNGGGFTYNNVVMNQSGSPAITGSNTFTNLTRTGAANKTGSLSIHENQTITGTLTINGNSPTNRLLVKSEEPGVSRTLTANAVSLSNVDFQDITGAGAAAPFTGTSLGDALGNSGITFTAAVTRYWVGNGGSWSDTARWSASSGGASGASVPLPQDDVRIDSNSISSASQVITLDMPRLGKNVDFTGVTNTPAVSVSSSDFHVFGSLTLVAGLTWSQLYWDLIFEGRSAYTLTSAGQTLYRVTVDSPGGTLTLQDDLTIQEATDQAVLQIEFGTFNANGFDCTLDYFSAYSNNATKVVNMGAGVWTITGTSTVWDCEDSGLTLNAETSTLVIADTSANSKNLAMGGHTYNNLTISGDNVIIQDNNTFSTLNVNTAGLITGLKLTSGTTQTITDMTTNGSTGNLAKMYSTSLGVAAGLKTTAEQISVDYMDLKDITGLNSVAADIYTVESTTYNWSTLTGSATSVVLGDDAGSGSISIPFTLNFFGISSATYYIASNGYVSFNNIDLNEYTPDPVGSSATPDEIIAGIWTDLNPGLGGTIKYETLGTTPNRVMVVEFDAVREYGQSGSDTSFQIKMYETTNVIEVHTRNFDNLNGAGALQGVENSDATEGTAVSGRNAENFTVSTPDAYKFTPGTSTKTDWYAGANSTDSGGNSGWIFSDPPEPSAGAFFQLF